VTIRVLDNREVRHASPSLLFPVPCGGQAGSQNHKVDPMSTPSDVGLTRVRGTNSRSDLFSKLQPTRYDLPKTCQIRSGPRSDARSDLEGLTFNADFTRSFPQTSSDSGLTASLTYSLWFSSLVALFRLKQRPSACESKRGDVLRPKQRTFGENLVWAQKWSLFYRFLLMHFRIKTSQNSPFDCIVEFKYLAVFVTVLGFGCHWF
jgi:hypothetical protein